MNEQQRLKAQLAEKLGARHPDMVKAQSAIETTETRINAEVGKVVQALRNDYQAAMANERSLQASLDQQRGEAQDLNRASIQYGVLQRDATSNQTMFSGLLERSRETGISGELKTSNIRIVDQAETPRKPASPNKVTNLALALQSEGHHRAAADRQRHAARVFRGVPRHPHERAIFFGGRRVQVDRGHEHGPG